MSTITQDRLFGLLATAESRLANYGSHHGWCQSQVNEAACDCGFEDALRQMRGLVVDAASEVIGHRYRKVLDRLGDAVEMAQDERNSDELVGNVLRAGLLPQKSEGE